MTERNPYRVDLDGYYTSVVMELTDAEVRFLERLEDEVNRVLTSFREPCFSVRAATMNDITEYHERLNEIEEEG